MLTPLIAGDIQENMVQQFQAGSEVPVNDQALTKDDLSQPRLVVPSISNTKFFKRACAVSQQRSGRFSCIAHWAMA